MTESESSSPTDIDLPPSLLARRHGAVAVLTLNRPAKRNALNDETVLGIERFFTHLPGDVRSVVLAAEGDHFSAGLDLSEMGEHDTLSGVRHSRMWHRALELVEFGPVPVVCALHGRGRRRRPGTRRRRSPARRRALDVLRPARGHARHLRRRWCDRCGCRG